MAPAHNARIITLSHYLPLTAILESALDEAPVWSLTSRRGHSAMYSGIASLAANHPCLHIGWIGHCHTKDGEAIPFADLTPAHLASLTTLLEGKSLIPVFLEDAVAKSHYDGYCKSTLWPLLHYQLWEHATDGRKELASYSDYLATNKAFVEAVLRVYQEGDIVWIHDYHLFSAPALLRAALPDAAIGFFLHTPFPSSEIFRCLPKRREILKGVLGANLVGFQIYSYARHFISSCTRVLGCESSPTGVHNRGANIAVGAFPVGIDVEKVRDFRATPAVCAKRAGIKDLFPGKRIILGRDHLDPTKGIIQKLQAFERFLQKFPECLEDVILVQVTTARHDSPKLEQGISEIIARINGTYGSISSVPVHYYNQKLEGAEFYALLEAADVALITPTRDGMNTTSYEWVMCQEERHGPLILSEFTGTAGSLSGAILVNPWDIEGVAQSIYDALHMSQEDKDAKYPPLYAHVTSCTSAFWAAGFVKELRSAMQLPDRSTSTPFLDVDACVRSYEEAGRRLLMFDYDGTLTAIRKTPQAAVPPPPMLEALRVMCADPKNTVWIISGRNQGDLEGWLGDVEGLGLSAEHGSFMRYPRSKEWVSLADGIDMAWKEEVKRIFDYYTERTQGSFVEDKICSVTWHYRLADPAYGEFQAKECQNHLENAILSKLPLEVLVGKKNLEVRPMSLNKGEIVRRLISESIHASLADPSTSPLQWTMCAGDDKTDEDMFRAIRKDADAPEERDWTITIGEKEKRTLARWHVPNPSDLLAVLRRLAHLP